MGGLGDSHATAGGVFCPLFAVTCLDISIFWETVVLGPLAVLPRTPLLFSILHPKEEEAGRWRGWW